MFVLDPCDSLAQCCGSVIHDSFGLSHLFVGTKGILILRQLSWSLSARRRSDSNKVVEKENMVGKSPAVPKARVTV